MGALKKLVIGIAAFCFLVFCALFGQLPRLRKTPFGMVNRLIWVRIPGLVVTADQYVTGGRCGKFLKRAGHYLMKENHPVVLIFYLVIMIGGEILFLPPVLAVLPWSYAWPVYPLVLMPYIFTYLTTTSRASFVTPETIDRQMLDYPYDRILYRPGLQCLTCNTLKPARSKHCRVCGYCVHRMDHHCVWVRNCLGKENYVYFLAMLFSLALMLGYGGYLGYSLLDATIQDHTDARRAGASQAAAEMLAGADLLRGERWTKGITWALFFDRWSWAFAAHLRVATAALLAAMTCPLAGGLLAYHVHLIRGGMTTNESFKWEEWAEDVQDGFVYMCVDPEGNYRTPAPGENPLDPEYGATTSALPLHKTLPDTEWPVDGPMQRVVSRANRTSLDVELVQGTVLGSEPWCKVEDFRDLINIYDLGMWGNLKDALNWS